MSAFFGADTELFVVPDARSDQSLLTDGAIVDDADPATDILTTYFTTVDLDRRGARQLRD